MKFFDTIDKKLILFLHQNHWIEPQVLWYFFSQKYLWFLFGIIILWKVRFFSKKQILMIILVFGICIFFTDRIASGFFKPFFQRLRPCHQDELKEFLFLYKNHCGGKYGFISSHAANIWGWIILYFQILKTNLKERVLWILVAVMISISRIMLGVHYLSDLIVGSILGIGVGYALGNLYCKWIQKK